VLKPRAPLFVGTRRAETHDRRRRRCGEARPAAPTRRWCSRALLRRASPTIAASTGPQGKTRAPPKSLVPRHMSATTTRPARSTPPVPPASPPPTDDEVWPNSGLRQFHRPKPHLGGTRNGENRASDSETTPGVSPTMPHEATPALSLPAHGCSPRPRSRIARVARVGQVPKQTRLWRAPSMRVTCRCSESWP
jgi:hypothetical protein